MWDKHSDRLAVKEVGREEAKSGMLWRNCSKERKIYSHSVFNKYIVYSSCLKYRLANEDGEGGRKEALISILKLSSPSVFCFPQSLHWFP